ncbi:hypothetical protein HDU84_009505 [Entophlyctis sp. JEL0112]|nr:hypothetical protein HDU84_009505 [Entophlyctis sp. JEL0112]
MVHPRVALSLEIQGLDADFEEEKKSFKSSSKPGASENDRFKETGLSNSESPSRTSREETSDIHINTCKEHENDHLPVNNESEVGLSICHGGDEVSGRYGADHSEIVLEETLQDISIISETAEEVLAALDMCDELDNAQEESSDASRSDNDAENRGAVERDRIKLPMDAIARKERGEVLWTVPHASPVNKAAGSSGDYASYIPKEDERTAQAIEQVLGVVPAGSTAEWELIAGRGRSKLRRSG